MKVIQVNGLIEGTIVGNISDPDWKEKEQKLNEQVRQQQKRKEMV